MTACSKVFLILILLLLPSIFLSPAARAQEKSGLEVTPAYTEVVLEKPSEQKDLEFSYQNHSITPIKLELKPVDLKGENDGQINFLTLSNSSYSYSLASYLSLESNSVELLPGEKKVFKVKVKNREDISPGGHYAALLASILSTGQDGFEDNPKITGQLASIILLRKTGGEIYKMNIKEASWPDFTLVFDIPTTIFFTFQNEGNIHLIPFGLLEIKDSFGRLIYQGALNDQSSIVMPGTRRKIPSRLTSSQFSLPISINRLQFNGQDSLKQVKYSYYKTFIYLNPWFLATLVILLIASLKIYHDHKK